MEASANTLQNVLSNQPVVFTETPVPSNSGIVFHRDESGIFRLASLTNQFGTCGCCGCFSMPYTLYQVVFHANIAVPATGGTVEPISMAIAIDGEIDPSSTMIFTPAAVGQFGNVGAEILVAVPAICRCSSVSVRNTSTQAIDVQNANIIFTYNGVRY